MKLPKGQGMWPAFWMLGADRREVEWPGCGEIDIMENIGREPALVHGSIHGPGYSGGDGLNAPFAHDLEGYHVYAIDWYPNRIDFYMDGIRYATRTPASLPKGGRWVFEHPFYLLINNAVGGTWPGAPDATTRFPQELRVDYVRVWAPAP
jgi:beta-glucanase (GH16 family)